MPPLPSLYQTSHISPQKGSKKRNRRAKMHQKIINLSNQHKPTTSNKKKDDVAMKRIISINQSAKMTWPWSIVSSFRFNFEHYHQTFNHNSIKLENSKHTQIWWNRYGNIESNLPKQLDRTCEKWKEEDEAAIADRDPSAFQLSINLLSKIAGLERERERRTNTQQQPASQKRTFNY